jgi:two-component system, chemotaxis family, sensor kinase CheA
MSNPSNDFLSKLIATFRLEADEHLQAMISGLLALEKATTPDEQAPTLEIIFREAHSLKGAARAVNLTEVEAVCQALEGVFARLKRRELELAPADFDIVHRALDTVNALLAEPDQPHAAEVAEAVQELARLETAPTTVVLQEAVTTKVQPSEEPTSHPVPTPHATAPASSPSNSVTLSPTLVSPTPAASAEKSLLQVAPSNTSQAVVSTPANDFLAKLIATFRLEADEHLKAMVAGLLALEKASVADDRQSLLETLFREAHSLKGAARAVDLTDVEAVCQALEGVLARLKRGEFQLSAEGFDAIHQSLDTIEVLLSEPNQPHATQIAEAVQRLTRLETANTPDMTESNSALQAGSPTQDVNSNSIIHHGTERPPLSSPLSLVPPAPAAEPAATRRASAPPVSPSHGDGRGEQSAVQAKPGIEETVRVTTAKLDSLFLQVEEMLSAKLSVNQHATDLKETLGILAEWRKEWAKVSAEIRKLQRLIEAKEDWTRQGAAYTQAVPPLVDFIYWNEQQFLALETRVKGLTKAAEHDQQTVGALVDSLLENTKRVLMMPFSSLLEIFPKMVRDLSRSLGKEVELLIRGGDVEIDKRILEELKTPLIHLIRNSLDHGIETPEVRAKYEKSPRGTIIITVSQTSGSSVEILISDDGGGIDRKKVTAAAVKKGFLSAEAAEKLDEQAALALIFQSEVSTSPIVTDISGRGLGMAIVREKIEKLGGQISMETHLQEGTSFRIVVPLTLATFRGVFVETAGRTFVIPTTSIERVARIKRSDVKAIDGKEAFFLEGRPIAFVYLDALLQLPRATVRRADEDTLLTVILSVADKRVACCVDEVENEQEVLFKSLGAFLSPVPNVAGATVLGSGKVIPILHVPDLLASASENGRARAVTLTAEGDSEAYTKSVLIAEDSVTSRMLLKGILESAGYQVTTAVDGMDAFSLLQKAHFDLLVSDVEMPRMNGFELTAKVRSTEPLAQVPVVLVTGLDSREDRERGITAGADAYIVKTSFDQSNLLDVVQRLI